MTAIDDTIANIKRWINIVEKHYQETQGKPSQAMEMCDKIIKSKDSTAERKVSASITKELVIMREQHWIANLANLKQNLILAQNIKMIELQVNLLSTVLIESGILNKVKNIEEITKLKNDIERFKKLLKKQHKKNVERQRQLQEVLDKLDKDFYVR